MLKTFQMDIISVLFKWTYSRTAMPKLLLYIRVCVFSEPHSLTLAVGVPGIKPASPVQVQCTTAALLFVLELLIYNKRSNVLVRIQHIG